MRTKETERTKWADIAKKNNWYKEPFFVQIWINKEGIIKDSIAFREMNRDIIVSYETDKEITQTCIICGKDKTTPLNLNGECVECSEEADLTEAQKRNLWRDYKEA